MSEQQGKQSFSAAIVAVAFVVGVAVGGGTMAVMKPSAQEVQAQEAAKVMKKIYPDTPIRDIIR